jgi:5-methylcytosine-specific restriction enzyme subunit McrC
MYAYGRFWGAEKALLLYPGDYHSPEFKAFKTRDFSHLEGEVIPMDHHCKMGYVSVLDTMKKESLDDQIGNKVLSLLEIDKKYAVSQ